MRRSLRTCAAIAVGLITTALLAAPPAQAAATEPGQSTQTGCAVNFHGHVGHQLCGTDFVRVEFDDGHERGFVIGLDHAVWNIVKLPNGSVSGWQSLHGWLQIDLWVDVFGGPHDLQIVSRGADFRLWCNRLHGTWSGWVLC